MDVGNLISGSSAFSKISLNIWKFMVHVLMKPGLENFERYFARMWDECNCAVVWIFFVIAFLWDWNENWPFPMKRLSSVTYEVTKINSDREKEKPASWEICMQIKKQLWEWDMEIWTGSKWGKKYIKAVYCYPAYLTYVQNTSCKILGWLKHWNQDCWEKYQ